MTTTTGASAGVPAHPILGFARALAGALSRVAEVEPTFMTTAEKAAALVELHRQEQRLVALRLRILASADDLAAERGMRDAAIWAASHTNTERGPQAADLRLAQALERCWARLGAALGEGRVNLAQARVIVRALEELPEDLPAGLVVRAEEHMVDLAARHRPRELDRLGRHLLEVLAPDRAEAEEGRRLEREEARARQGTSLQLKRLGDGCTRITAKVPDAAADRLATYLDAFTSPRHHEHDGDPGDHGDHGVLGEADRIPAHRKRGQAFVALLEHLDPTRLPEHGGDATTVIITLTLHALRAELAAAGVITADQADISASQARRLACTANLIPAVLGGHGEVLDLGRTRRLFTRAQRKALRLRDRRCRAEHCTIPAGWSEAHHWHPWHTGGPTDLTNGILLCNYHHHRAHDTRYRADRLPNGDVRFTRRT